MGRLKYNESGGHCGFHVSFNSFMGRLKLIGLL